MAEGLSKNSKAVLVSVAEKRALTQIVERQYSEAINKALKEQEALQEEAEKIVIKELGIDMLDLEIEKLQKQIALIEKRISDMGVGGPVGHRGLHTSTDYSSGTYRQVWKKGTKATERAYKHLNATTNLSELQKEKNVKLKQIWLEVDREAIRKLVGNGAVKVEVKKLNAKQLKAKND